MSEIDDLREALLVAQEQLKIAGEMLQEARENEARAIARASELAFFFGEKKVRLM